MINKIEPPAWHISGYRGEKFYNHLREARAAVKDVGLDELHDRIRAFSANVADQRLFTRKSEELGWKLKPKRLTHGYRMTVRE